jgi:hypothetical protein
MRLGGAVVGPSRSPAAVAVIRSRRVRCTCRPRSGRAPWPGGARVAFVDLVDQTRTYALRLTHRLTLGRRPRHGLAEVVPLPRNQVDAGKDPHAKAAARQPLGSRSIRPSRRFAVVSTRATFRELGPSHTTLDVTRAAYRGDAALRDRKRPRTRRAGAWSRLGESNPGPTDYECVRHRCLPDQRHDRSTVSAGRSAQKARQEH